MLRGFPDTDSKGINLSFMAWTSDGASFSVSHLSFADNSLLFLRATLEGDLVLKSALSRFEQLSGLKVNLEKSAVFSLNLFVGGESDGLGDMLGVPESVRDGKYLGLSYLIGRSKKNVCNYIRERVDKKTRGGKKNWCRK